MKRKLLLATTMVACAVSCVLGFAACDFGDGNNGDDNKKYVVYHLNGGYYGSDSDDTEDHRSTLYDNEIFIPSKAKKDTWVLENWYFDEALTEVYSEARFAQLRAQQDEIDLYAKWIDEITVTKDNFTEYFSVSSRWNGGLNAGSGGNAGIYYSISPKMTYDPANSAEGFEVEVTPVLTKNNEVVWSSETTTVTLTSEADYSCSYIRKISASAVGVAFDIAGRTLEYELLTESFQLKLMHKVPVEITLDLGDGETEVYNATGSEMLRKSDLPTPEKAGYRFMGWYTDAEYNTEYEDKAVTRARTLYAKFAKEVTVTFHANGGTEKDALELLGGDLINTYTPEREDYKFLGWYTDSDFENKFEAGTRAAETDVNLYAKWAKIHTVTFVTNGGSAIEDMRVVDGETPQMYRVSTTKSGVTFMGWYTDSACENKYEEGPLDGDLTLYAFWARTMSLYNPSLEDLKEYVNINVTEEYTTITENKLIYNVRKVTVTASIKEEYLRPGLSIYNGSIQIKFTLENGQEGSSGYFDKITLSTQSGQLEYEGEYIIKAGYGGYEETATWKLNCYLTCTVYLLEEANAE